MKQEELKKYQKCQAYIDAFEEQLRIDGDRVTDRIAKIQAADGKNHQGDYNEHNYVYINGEWGLRYCGDDANYAECYRIEGDTCYWWGVSKSYDDCTIYEAGKFEVELLFMTDEELDAWSEQRIAEIKAEIERANELKRQKNREARERAKKRKEENERELLAKLKAKYEPNE